MKILLLLIISMIFQYCFMLQSLQAQLGYINPEYLKCVVRYDAKIAIITVNQISGPCSILDYMSTIDMFETFGYKTAVTDDSRQKWGITTVIMVKCPFEGIC